MPGYEIDTNSPNTTTQTSPHTFLVKDFQDIGECSIKENGLEHSLGHPCPSTKTHTGAFKRGQKFYVDAIKRLSSWKWKCCKKSRKKGGQCYSGIVGNHENETFHFIPIKVGGPDGTQVKIALKILYKTGIYMHVHV